MTELGSTWPLWLFVFIFIDTTWWIFSHNPWRIHDKHCWRNIIHSLVHSVSATAGEVNMQMNCNQLGENASMWWIRIVKFWIPRLPIHISSVTASATTEKWKHAECASFAYLCLSFCDKSSVWRSGKYGICEFSSVVHIVCLRDLSVWTHCERVNLDEWHTCLCGERKYAACKNDLDSDQCDEPSRRMKIN